MNDLWGRLEVWLMLPCEPAVPAITQDIVNYYGFMRFYHEKTGV